MRSQFFCQVVRSAARRELISGCLVHKSKKGEALSIITRFAMKATGIVRRIDDLGRVVIPKEIRRTLRIREGDPSQITLTEKEKFVIGVEELAKMMVLE